MDQLSNLNDISISLLGFAPLAVAAVVIILALRYQKKADLALPQVSTKATLLVMALTAGVMALACFFLRFSVFPPGGSDNYFPRALNIIRYGVIGFENAPSTVFPPGYSVLMVPAAWLLGESRWVFFLTNMTMLVGTSIVVSSLLQKMGMDKGEANFVGLLLFLYPNRLLSTLLPFSDIPFSLVYLLAFMFMLLAVSHPDRAAYPVAAGLVAGAAALIRATGVPLLLPLVIGLWRAPIAAGLSAVPETVPRLRTRNVMLFLTAACVVLMPWTIRNLVLFGQIIPVSSNFGYNIAIGNNPDAGVTHNGYIDSLAHDPGAWVRFGADTTWNVAQVDRFLLRKGLDYIRDHPMSFVVRGAGKVLHTFASDASSFGMNATYGNLSTLVFGVTRALEFGPTATAVSYAVYATGYRILFVLNNAFYYVSLALWIMLLIRHRRRWSGPELAYIGVVLITCLLVFVLFGNSRFKEPIPSLTLVLMSFAFVKGGALRQAKPAHDRGTHTGDSAKSD